MRFSLQTAAGKPLTRHRAAGARRLARRRRRRQCRGRCRRRRSHRPTLSRSSCASLPGGDDNDATPRNGIEFRWSPPGISRRQRHLPHLQRLAARQVRFRRRRHSSRASSAATGDDAPSTAATDLLTVRPEWSDEGKPSIDALPSTVANGCDCRAPSTPLAAGRWTQGRAGSRPERPRRSRTARCACGSTASLIAERPASWRCARMTRRC